MKLRTGKARYRLHVPIGRVDHALIEGNQRHNQMAAHMLCQVAPEQLPRNALRGFPTRFCVFDKFVEFHPVPDKPYIVRVRYQPPMQEL